MHRDARLFSLCPNFFWLAEVNTFLFLPLPNAQLADMMYEHGAYEQASEAYQKAKSCGATDAQCNIGVMHMTGKGLAMDYHLAKRNFDLAAQSEDGYIPSAIAQCVLRFCTPRQALCTLIFDVAYVIRGRMSYEDLELPEKQVRRITSLVFRNTKRWSCIIVVLVVLASVELKVSSRPRSARFSSV